MMGDAFQVIWPYGEERGEWCSERSYENEDARKRKLTGPNFREDMEVAGPRPPADIEIESTGAICSDSTHCRKYLEKLMALLTIIYVFMPMARFLTLYKELSSFYSPVSMPYTKIEHLTKTWLIAMKQHPFC